MRSNLGRSQLISLAKSFAITFIILLAWVSITAHAITAEQARDLPEQELAKQVLGDAGKLFVEVRRPDWQDGAIIFANPKIEGKTPPLRYLVFYGRPAVAGFAHGIEGLCEAQKLWLGFSKTGDVGSLNFEKVYGFSQPVTFGNPFPSAPAHLNELQQRCTNTSAQPFFSALRGASGDVGEAVYAVQQVHEAMAHGGAPWLTLTCSISQNCDAAHFVESTTVGQIDSVADCSPGWEKADGQSHPKDRCWKIGLGGTRCIEMRELLVVLYDEPNGVEIRSVAFHDSRVVC